MEGKREAIERGEGTDRQAETKTNQPTDRQADRRDFLIQRTAREECKWDRRDNIEKWETVWHSSVWIYREFHRFETLSVLKVNIFVCLSLAVPSKGYCRPCIFVSGSWNRRKGTLSSVTLETVRLCNVYHIKVSHFGGTHAFPHHRERERERESVCVCVCV